MVSYLQAGGQKRPFYFRFSALARLCDDLGISLSQLGTLEEKLKVSSIEKILYYGLVAGCEKEDKTVDFDQMDILDWLDEDFDLISRGMELFAEQIEAYTDPKKKKPKAVKRMTK